jgi:hypothetical protein
MERPPSGTVAEPKAHRLASIGLDLNLSEEEIEREPAAHRLGISLAGSKATLLSPLPTRRHFIEKDADFAKFAARILPPTSTRKFSIGATSPMVSRSSQGSA